PLAPFAVPVDEERDTRPLRLDSRLQLPRRLRGYGATCHGGRIGTQITFQMVGLLTREGNDPGCRPTTPPAVRHDPMRGRVFAAIRRKPAPRAFAKRPGMR